MTVDGREEDGHRPRGDELWMVDSLGSTHGFVDERRRRALAHSSVCVHRV